MHYLYIIWICPSSDQQLCGYMIQHFSKSDPFCPCYQDRNSMDQQIGSTLSLCTFSDARFHSGWAYNTLGPWNILCWANLGQFAQHLHQSPLMLSLWSLGSWLQLLFLQVYSSQHCLWGWASQQVMFRFKAVCNFSEYFCCSIVYGGKTHPVTDHT